MKIAIVAPSPVPYTPGGAESVWSGLYRQLTGTSEHDVEMIKVPIRETTLPEVMDAYQTFSRLDLTHFDLIISGKYPAWMVAHPRHVVYMLHPLRGLYDSYQAFRQPTTESSAEPKVRRLLSQVSRVSTADHLPELFERWHDAVADLGTDHPALRFPGPLARSLVHAMDRAALRTGAISSYLAISRTVARRADYFPPDAVVEVVHPPSDLQDLHSLPGEFFFTASRHDQPKRLDLLIAGMAHYRGTSRLLIGGRGPESDRLAELAADDPRIVFTGRLSQIELADHYARAIGVPFVPIDEDLGLITFEALRSGKPVLTTRDSGGPMEFVVPGRNGIVVAPTASDIGAGLARLEELAAHPEVADRARSTVSAITWRRLAERLLVGRAVSPVDGGPSGRPKLVITSTFPIWPPLNGGQLRAFHLYGALASRFDVEVVCLAHPEIPPSVRRLSPGLVERVVPRSQEHQLAEHEITREVGIPVTDIVDGQLILLTPDYLTALRKALDGADGIILAHPFLHPAVQAIDSRLPIVYDANNCEYALKSQMLPATAAGDRLRAVVRTVEGNATVAAELVLTVSDEDREQLERLYGVSPARFTLIPNGVDLDSVSFTSMPLRARNRERWISGLRKHGGGEGITRLATFIGSWHLPNNEAGAAIVRMAAELPHVGFLLVGAHTRTLRSMKVPPNVFLLGTVSNGTKQALLASVDIALAPLLTGSGTNLKVVEYLAAGAPIVSTEVGCRGLRMDRSLVRTALIADFPAAIRAELAAAEENPDAVAEKTLRGRRGVEDAYGWNSLGSALTRRLEQVLHLPAPAADGPDPGFSDLWPGRRPAVRWRSGSPAVADQWSV